MFEKLYFQVLGKNLETMVRCGNWAAAHCIKVLMFNPKLNEHIYFIFYIMTRNKAYFDGL